LQNITVDVLVTTITWGASGPAVPLKTEVQIGVGASFTPAFGDQTLTAGMPADVIPIGVTDPATITFKADAAYSDFTSPFWTRSIMNTDPQNAIVLLNGDNFFDISAQKGVQTPFDGQQDILSILSSFIDSTTGLVTLPAADMLVLYELGTTNPLSPAFDFQDLVVKTSTGCAAGQETVVKDHVSDPANWDGGEVILNFFVSDTSLFNKATGAAFTGNGDELSRVGLIWAYWDKNNIANQGDPTTLQWRLAFYDDSAEFSSDAFRINPPQPNYLQVFTTPTNPDWLYINGNQSEGLNIVGQTGGIVSNQIFNLFYAEFDVSFLHIQTTLGQEHLISIVPNGPIFGNIRTLVSPSSGVNAIGTNLDWFEGDGTNGNIGPDTIHNIGFLGGGGFDFAAFKVVTITP